jgi:PIN domain nuclease of toxin-antitoxin system
MRLLLDTHALLWWLFDDPRLTATARSVLMDRANEVPRSSSSA